MNRPDHQKHKTDNMSDVRVIAFYLPQYHPIPENDKWWGKGFTEWTNVGKARPLFKGHDQPKVPADLGYYDLRVPETREAQAEMARSYGIEGFLYWHYWFGKGKRLLERPFNEVLASGKPDFPFCLGWANHSWQGIYCGVKSKEALIEQTYGGEEEYKAHFYDVLPAFRDKRYIRFHGKPLFYIHSPLASPEVPRFVEVWQRLARENGLEEICFVGNSANTREDIRKVLSICSYVNVDTLFEFKQHDFSFFDKVRFKIMREVFKVGNVYEYKKAMRYFYSTKVDAAHYFPTLIPNWDHTPRTGAVGNVLNHSTPALFGEHAKTVFEKVKEKPAEDRIVFLKSWNEWAEGNYMEPDLTFGHGYLEALDRAIREVFKK